MNILHFIDSAGLYGAEAVVLALAADQRRQGHSATIVSIGSRSCGEKPLEREADRLGLAVQRIRMAVGPNLSGARKLMALAQRERADILHSHGYKTDILLGFLPRRLRRVPLIATVHGYTHAQGFDRMRLYKWLDLRVLRRCDCVVLVYPDMARAVGLETLDQKRVRVIENGIANLATSRDAATADPRIVEFCRRGPIIGAVGRLSPEKGFDRLIAGFGRLIRAGASARLVILGEGSERPALERSIAERGLQDHVLLPGFADTAPHLPLFDVFVLPSLSEGLPISLLEAMRAGVPIVASRVGGVAALLCDGQGGLLVEAGQVDALMCGIDRILSDRLLAERLARVSKATVRAFSSERMADRYLELYAELITRPLSHMNEAERAVHTTRSQV